MQDILATVSVIIASLSVIVGIVYYFFILRDARKREKIDLLIRIYNSYNNKEFYEADSLVLEANFKDYDDFKKKYGSPDGRKPIYLALRQITDAFEQLGFLLHSKLIDINMIQPIFAVKQHWEKVKPIVEGVRKELNNPTFLMFFEYLYNEWMASQVKS